MGDLAAAFAVLPGGPEIRYIVRAEQWYRPVSNSRAQTCAGGRSAYSGWLSRASTAARSSALSAEAGAGLGFAAPGCGGLIRR